jgi:hypothetical protein
LIDLCFDVAVWARAHRLQCVALAAAGGAAFLLVPTSTLLLRIAGFIGVLGLCWGGALAALPLWFPASLRQKSGLLASARRAYGVVCVAGLALVGPLGFAAVYFGVIR